MTVAEQTYTVKKDEDSRVKRIEEDIGTHTEYDEGMPRSKAAEQRAKAAEQQAKVERQKKLKLAAKLRELGIAPESL